MDAVAKIDKPLRIMLWSVPRSLSTVFEKCVSFVPNVQIINEMYTCAYHMSPEKYPVPDSMKDMINEKLEEYNKDLQELKMDLPMAFDADQCTYEFVKCELEANYPGKQIVFAKDMAYALNGRYDMLPLGFRHTFLIRNPYRVFPSFRNLWRNFPEFREEKEFRFCDLPPAFIPKNYGFQELYELLLYLQEHGEPDPIIVDADDLLRDPVSMMRRYCTLIGIPFREEMLEWPSGIDTTKSWKAAREFLLGNFHKTGGYYDAALNSSRFHPLKEAPGREDLPEDTLDCVDHSMPYYQKMHDLRLQ